MTLRYNLTGSDRKRLVSSISEITGASAKYLGAPSFAYQVDYFTIDRNGGVTFDDRADSEEIENLIETLDSQGFKAEPQAVEASEPVESAPAEVDGLCISMPASLFTETTLQNLKDIIASKGNLIRKAMGVDELPVDMVLEMRKAVKQADPEATLLGEVWEDASNKTAYGVNRSYCLGDMLDSVMNYPLRCAVIDFFTGVIDAYQLRRVILHQQEVYPAPFYYSLMNLLGSHDKPRAINVLADCGNMQPERRYRFPLELTKEQYERGKRRLIAAWTLICALPGMPCIYYGDEAGLTGMADPFCRKTFPWGREDEELTEKMREQSLKRRNSPALRTGDMRIYAESADALVVERFIEHGQDVFGNSAKDERVRVRIDRKGL